MCGNGGRCIAAFAETLGLIGEAGNFLAVDGPHPVIIANKNGSQTDVSLKMIDVEEVEYHENYLVLNTGSPHYVTFSKDIDSIDVNKSGSEIRYNQRFRDEGINVNFVQALTDSIKVRTYERGVEAETLSCGTGVTASVLATALTHFPGSKEIVVETPGGTLTVQFEKSADRKFKNIWLRGPATMVFRGEIEILPATF
jgi:diaminopimelate epimerase